MKSLDRLNGPQSDSRIERRCGEICAWSHPARDACGPDRASWSGPQNSVSSLRRGLHTGGEALPGIGAERQHTAGPVLGVPH